MHYILPDVAHISSSDILLVSQFLSVQLFVFISTIYYKDKPVPSHLYKNILNNYFKKRKLG